MGGVVTHLVAALAAAGVIHALHFRWEFSLSIFVGNFIPDVLKFGLSAIKQGTLAIFHIEQDSFYHFLSSVTSDVTNWFSLGFFTVGLTALFYKYHILKEEEMLEVDEMLALFIVGIVIHLVIDIFILETGPWI